MLSASLAITASSDETALQIRQALLGIQALALLRSSEEPEQGAIAQLAKIGGAGASASMTLDLPKSMIENAISQARGARSRPNGPQPRLRQRPLPPPPPTEARVRERTRRRPPPGHAGGGRG
jgi:hypothetical protein